MPFRKRTFTVVKCLLDELAWLSHRCRIVSTNAGEKLRLIQQVSRGRFESRHRICHNIRSGGAIKPENFLHFFHSSLLVYTRCVSTRWFKSYRLLDIHVHLGKRRERPSHETNEIFGPADGVKRKQNTQRKERRTFYSKLRRPRTVSNSWWIWRALSYGDRRVSLLRVVSTDCFLRLFSYVRPQIERNI